jgi:hypothetical protein
MSYVLTLWLEDVPENTVLFCRLILLGLLVSQLTYGLQGGIQAVGKIRHYQMTMGIVKILVLPAVYVLLKIAGLPVYVAVFSFLFVEVINFFVRLYFAGKLLNIKKTKYFLTVFLRLSPSFVLAYFLCTCMLHFVPEESFGRLVLIIFLSSVVLLTLLKLLILNKKEYLQVKNTVSNFKNKIYNK